MAICLGDDRIVIVNRLPDILYFLSGNEKWQGRIHTLVKGGCKIEVWSQSLAMHLTVFSYSGPQSLNSGME